MIANKPKLYSRLSSLASKGAGYEQVTAKLTGMILEMPHAYLLFGFTLARANARMLINAASKRSSAKNAVRTSRSRSP